MRRLLIALVGFVVLIAGAVTLWIAWGPQPTEARTTGGVLYTQQEVAQSGADLSATTDVQVGAGPAEVPAQADLAPSLSADLAAGNLGAAPQLVAPQDIAPDVPLTTDVVLSDSTNVAVAPLVSAQGAPLEGQGGFTSSTTGYEQRVVELEWPGHFQVGRSGALRIKLKMLEGGALQPVAEVAGNEVIATPILITDRYDNYNAFVTATISAPDFTVGATSPATQPMQRGGEVEWRWTLESTQAQTSVISLGLAITWEPKPGQPPGPTNVPIWGQTLQVDVSYVFGLITVPQASIAGTALAVLGFIAQMPLLEKFLEIFLDLLFGRDRRRRDEEKRDKKRRRR
jgi:hypothetical protein